MKTPPNDIEIEYSVLCSILTDEQMRKTALESLSTDDFYNTANRIIFIKCGELSKNGNPFEAGNIWADLSEQQRQIVGGAHKFSKIWDAPPAVDIYHYCRKLKDCTARRKSIEYTNAIQKLVATKDGDLNRVREYAKQIISETDLENALVNQKQVIMPIQNFISLKLPEKKTILDPWITEQNIGLINGWRGTGKTWLGLGIIDAVTKGQNFGPWEVENSVPCLFLDAEMPVQDLQYRAMQLKMGENTKSPVYIYSSHSGSELGLPKANLTDEKWQAFMKKNLLDLGVKLWVADNIGALASGINENSKEAWDPINQWLLDLRFSGISTILLHHTGKEGDQRGTSAREDNVDTSITITLPPGHTAEDGCHFIMKFKKNRVVSGDQILLADLDLKYQSGIWTYQNIKLKSKNEILTLLDEGNKQAEIAKELDVSKPYISRIRREAITEGYLTEDNKLTDIGKAGFN
jgi:putative DNA primase/helicase